MVILNHPGRLSHSGKPRIRHSCQTLADAIDKLAVRPIGSYPPVVRPPRISIPPWFFAVASVLPLFVWWLGWYPGFASSDSIDQFSQIADGVYVNGHPPIHTWYLDVLSLGGSTPGLVTLFQLLILGVLLAYAAKWLAAAGVPIWLAVGVAWLLGLSPAVAPTTLALWKDVPFAMFMLWAWVELLALAVEPRRTIRLWPAVRLGVALAGVWLFRGNGPITVLLLLLVLAWVYRRHFRLIIATTGAAALTVFLILGPMYSILDVEGSGTEPAQVFLPDIAASYGAEPETFSQSDIDLLVEIAPLTIWTTRYDCYDSTPLLFDPKFNQAPVRDSPGAYLDLEIDVYLRDLDSVMGHRVCAANFLYSPAQPDNAYFHRPPYEIPANTVGLARAPKSDLALRVTDRVWRWAEVDTRLWLTWRPAILILPALAAIIGFAVSARRFLIPSSLFLAHTVNVFSTSPTQEFRYAYPLYLLAAVTLTLLWPTLKGARKNRADS